MRFETEKVSLITVFNDMNRCFNTFVVNQFGSVRTVLQRIMTQKSVGNILGDHLYIIFPDRHVNLHRHMQESACETETNWQRVSSYLDRKLKSYLIIPNGSFRDEDIYVKSAITAHKLYRESSVWSDFTFAFVLSCPENLKRAPKYGVVRRCLWAVKSGVGVKSTSQDNLMIKYVQQLENLSVFEVLLEDGDNSKCIFQEVSEKDHGKSFTFCVENTCDKDKSFWIFNNPSFSPVFHSYGEARCILQKCYDIPAVKELLEIADGVLLADFKKQSVEINLLHPFVVVEGLDATGKTTLTKILEEKLGAARYYTPPLLVQHLRHFFDTMPEIVRRAYYSVGNYLVAMEIAKECQTRPVIMDRYWHSTAAYGIANESSTADLPELGHMVYKWPKDLLRPSVVLFLSVTEEVCRQRLSGRGEESTFEEKHLDRDKLFRQRLCEAYRRMEDPSCIEIDACGSVESVMQSALEVLETQDISFNQKT